MGQRHTNIDRTVAAIVAEHEPGWCATPLRLLQDLYYDRYNENGRSARFRCFAHRFLWGSGAGVRMLSPFWRMFYEGRDVPRERMLAVADHYYHFEGRSPINDQNRALIAALRAVRRSPQSTGGIATGIRCWRIRCARCGRTGSSARDGVPSAFGSISGVPEYRENIEWARAEVGDGAPEIEKIPPFSGHPVPGGDDGTACGRAELPGAEWCLPRIACRFRCNRATGAASRRVAEALGRASGRWCIRAAAGRRHSRGSSRISGDYSAGGCTPTW